MRFHKSFELPNEDEIFVFETTTSGEHWGRSGFLAEKKYGAKFGKGNGLSGKSYAIPIRKINYTILSFDELKKYIDEFVQFTKDNTNLKFFVTRIGQEKLGAGVYGDELIAPLFKEAINCSFPEEWRPWLE